MHGLRTHPSRRAKRLRELGKAGVDVDDVTETLEEEGAAQVRSIFDELLDGIRASGGELGQR